MATPTNVLVIDPGKGPVSVMTWQRALMYFLYSEEVRKAAAEREIATALDDEGKPMKFIEVLAWQGEDSEPVVIRSGGGVEYFVPSVVVLSKPTVKKKLAPRYSFDNVYARDGGRCQYCGEKVPRSDAEREHVVPRSQGGRTCWENIVVGCRPCNSRKANRTPEQAGMKLLRKPVRPSVSMLSAAKYRYSVPAEWKRFLAGGAVPDTAEAV